MALRLVDDNGLEELSIRRLALALGVHPTSIYRRASSRDEILDLVGDAVLAEINVGGVTGSWRKRLVMLGERFRDAVLRHPGAAGLLNSWTTAQEANLRFNEAVFAALLEAGFRGRRLLEAYITYTGFVVGASVTEVLARATGTSAANAARAPLPANQTTQPSLTEALAQFGPLLETQRAPQVRRQVFRAGIETILRGLVPGRPTP